MSEDKRLGANPLEWVARDQAASRAETSFPTEPAPQAATAEAQPAATGTIGESKDVAVTIPDTITISDTVSEEDRMSNGKVKIKQTLDTAHAAAYLEDLAKSLVSGVVRVQSGDDNIALFAADTMKFEMKLSRKKDKAKCSIEMEWVDDGSNAAGFTIAG